MTASVSYRAQGNLTSGTSMTQGLPCIRPRRRARNTAGRPSVVGPAWSNRLHRLIGSRSHSFLETCCRMYRGVQHCHAACAVSRVCRRRAGNGNRLDLWACQRAEPVLMTGDTAAGPARAFRIPDKANGHPGPGWPFARARPGRAPRARLAVPFRQGTAGSSRDRPSPGGLACSAGSRRLRRAGRLGRDRRRADRGSQARSCRRPGCTGWRRPLTARSLDGRKNPTGRWPSP